jgi:hypothetical protein
LKYTMPRIVEHTKTSRKPIPFIRDQVRRD